MRITLMAGTLLKLLRAFRRDEAGQSLVVIVSSMSVVLGLAAFAIDASSWMLHHHQDQVVADSAALAAANCLANPGLSAGSITINGTLTAVPTCTSSTDTTDATTVAEDYAAANGVTISASQISFDTTNDNVTVTPNSSAPGMFAQLFGIGSATQTAGAKAGWTPNDGSCSTPGKACGFLFAHDTSCSSPSDGITLSDNGNTAVNGTIISNSNITGNTDGNVSLGTGIYGPGSCSESISSNGHDPWDSPPTQEAADVPYPIDYSKDFPACVEGSTDNPCDSVGYPSWCTNEGGISAVILSDNNHINGDTLQSGQIYCAAGTGTKSDPSTWNGTISVSLNGSSAYYDTFVGGSIDLTSNGKFTLSSCGYAVGGYTAGECSSSASPSTTNYPLFYATGNSGTACSTSTTVLCLALGGRETLNGDMYAPNGNADLEANGKKALTSFIEANDITANIGGTFTGDGPTSVGDPNGNGPGGTDTLLQ
jgi:hypothetical protein